jgi:short subunit dehydrogenase-like uncharacterized protein
MPNARGLFVFGATGYTARLILERALHVGLEPILVARNAARLEDTARRFGLEARNASSDWATLADTFEGASVVINAAGPFVNTVAPVVRACLAANAHYMDISGEVDAIEAAAKYHHDARRRGLTILPGAGFDVVPSDCLCAHVTRRLPGAHALRVAISGLELLTPGSVKTLGAELGRPTRVRRDGALREVHPGALTRSFDFGAGPRECVAVSWGDLASAYYSTGVRHIETYFEATPSVTTAVQANRFFGAFLRLPSVRAAIEQQAGFFGSEPSREERASRRAAIAVEAEGPNGRVASSRLTTPEAYTLTAETAVEIAKRLLDGDLEPGFQTPSRLYGPDFILRFAGVSRTDAEVRS